MSNARFQTNPVEIYNLGVVFYNRKDYVRAISEFKNAIKIEPKNMTYVLALANAYNNLAVMKYEARKYVESAEDFKKALELDPANEQFAQNLRLAQDSKSKDEIDRLCKGAYEAFNNKNYSESIRCLNDAHRIVPHDEDIEKALSVAYNGRGVFYYTQKKFEKARADFRTAYKIRPSQTQFGENLRMVDEVIENTRKKR
jgi:tetratricopeptide (TPR) repeat protein